MADHLREEVCHAISALSPSCSLEEAKTKLDPLFQFTAGIKFDFKSQITPLIVACDKGNDSCLKYLLLRKLSNEKLGELIGSPTDISSNEDKNTAIHHAAMGGCEFSIEMLSRYGESLVSLASIRNSHGDTPLMMAAANGHLGFIRRFYLLLVQEAGHRAAQSHLLAKNNSKDSCLSLASCQGHPAVVQLLVGLTPIESDLFHTCKTRFERMDTTLRSNPELMEKNRTKLDSVRQCVDTLEETLSRQAEENAMKLLAEEQEAAPKERPKQKRKKKQPRKSNETYLQAKQKISPPKRPPSRDTSDMDDPVRLTTLCDGTKAVVVPGEKLGKPELRLPASIRMEDPSAEEMFRRRFEGASANVGTVMDALCLDISMLLYTPHGMALNLSPSQLDAIQDILQKQLIAVQEARNIQDRVHAI